MTELANIGRYKIVSELGRGGMATVYHAYDPRFERDVAIKVLPRALQHDPQFRTRFEREAKTIALLEHPAIVPVYDFGEQDEEPYIVMRLMTGGSLSNRLENGPLPPAESYRITARLASALDVAHEKGIVHRDLKPGNILFDQYGNAFLSDFGIARITETGEGLTGSAIIGTPAFMSPEQIQGDKSLDGRSDQYGLGIILYYMLTKEMPFQADTPAKVMMMHILDPVPDIARVRPDLPAEIAAVIEKALAKNPDDRFADGRALSAALAKAIQEVSPESILGSSPSPGGPGVVEAPTVRGDLEEGLEYRETEVQRPGVPQSTLPVLVSSPLMWAALGGGALIVIFLVAASLLGFRFFGNRAGIAAATTTTPAATAPPTASPPPEPTQTVAILAAADTALPEPTTEVVDTPMPEPTDVPAPRPPIIGGADKLAYVMDGNIWVVNLDGTELRQLTQDGGSKRNLKWSLDGQAVYYLTGKCIQAVSLAEEIEIITCFRGVDLFDGFDISPDGTQIGFSLDQQLFIVPFDRMLLNPGHDISRSDLIVMATCEHYAPYDRNLIKNVRWSADGRFAAIKIQIPNQQTNLREDLVEIRDFGQCVESPFRVDNFPGNRFEVDDYDTSPIIADYSWDGAILFTMNSFFRNQGFGDLYAYNMENKRGNKINPIGGRCCYRDARWSPDGRMLLFAFQDFAQGSESVTRFYFVPFATIQSGQQLVPLDIPPLTNPRDIPQPALRPAQLP